MSDDKMVDVSEIMRRIRSLMIPFGGGQTQHTGSAAPKVKMRQIIATRNDILQRLPKSIPQQPKQQFIAIDGLKSYFEQTSTGVANTRAENEQIIQMIPEVSQTAAIVIPSILSPNDLQEGSLEYRCTHPKITEDQRSRIGDILRDHFEKHRKLSERLPNWIMEALYKAGAQPVVVIPVSELDRLYGQLSEERLSDHLAASVFGVADSAFTTPVSVTTCVESLDTHIRTSYHTDRPASTRRPEMTRLVESVLSRESIVVDDNIDALRANYLRQSNTLKRTQDTIRKRYMSKTTLVDSLGVPSHATQAQHNDYAFMMELPSESVIPITAPGMPSSHIGYFVILDEHGTPITDTNSTLPKQQGEEDPRHNHFKSLYQAYGIGRFDISTATMDRSHHRRIYQQIVEAHLTNRMKDAGYGSVAIHGTDTIYQHLLSMYLSHRRVKFLYIPKQFMTYLCYDYNKNGTGRSRLEDIKFIISLRITLLISYLMSAINNSADRRRIEVNLQENTTGNPLEILKTIQREAIKKNIVDWTWDPNVITQTIAEKGISVKVNGLSGLENYTVTNESNDRRGADVDSTLMESLENQLTLGLKVPPSALNALSEFEYSRSVATSNLFFSLDIKRLQRTTITHLTDLVQTDVAFSPPLQQALLDIVRIDTDTTDRKDGVVNEDDAPLLHDLIQHLSVSLPAPDIAPSKSQMEEMSTFASNFSTAVDQMFSDELVSRDDEEGQATLATIRGYLKAMGYRRWMSTVGSLTVSEIPDLGDETLIPNLMAFNQMLRNISMAIQGHARVLKPKEGSDDSSPF